MSICHGRLKTSLSIFFQILKKCGTFLTALAVWMVNIVELNDLKRSAFFTHKHYFSIALQAVADANKRFLTIEVGGRGKQSDGGTFNASSLNRLLERGAFNIPEPRTLPNSNITAPYVIVADEAYPLKEYLMRPYPQRILN